MNHNRRPNRALAPRWRRTNRQSRFGLWRHKRRARRLPRRPRHRRGKLGRSPIYCGYYTISGNRESGFPAAFAAESRPQPGRSGVTGAGRGVCRAGPATGGQIGPKPNLLRLLYHIRKPRRRFPRRARGGSRPQPGRSGVTGAGRGVCRAGPATGGAKLGRSPIYCGYYTILRQGFEPKNRKPVENGRRDLCESRRLWYHRKA